MKILILDVIVRENSVSSILSLKYGWLLDRFLDSLRANQGRFVKKLQFSVQGVFGLKLKFNLETSSEHKSVHVHKIYANLEHILYRFSFRCTKSHKGIRLCDVLASMSHSRKISLRLTSWESCCRDLRFCLNVEKEYFYKNQRKG